MYKLKANKIMKDKKIYAYVFINISTGHGCGGTPFSTKSNGVVILCTFLYNTHLDNTHSWGTTYTVYIYILIYIYIYAAVSNGKRKPRRFSLLIRITFAHHANGLNGFAHL
jgi:hypothetical protein